MRVWRRPSRLGLPMPVGRVGAEFKPQAAEQGWVGPLCGSGSEWLNVVVLHISPPAASHLFLFRVRLLRNMEVLLVAMADRNLWGPGGCAHRHI